MSNKMNLIFEPADLEQASPATVSRVGMISFEPHQLGWKPYKDSYMEHELPATLTQDHKNFINDMFEWLIQPCLDFIRHECKMLLQTSEIHLLYTLTRLYSCLLDEIANSGKEGHDQLSTSQVSNHDILT